MKLYIFQAGDEFFKIKIDRVEKKLEIASSKTTYRFLPQPYWKLFGDPKKTMLGLKPPTEEESKKDMIKMELLNDKEFKDKLIKNFANFGYKLIKKSG